VSDLVEKLNRMRDLPRGWDSYDACAIDERAINTALVLVQSLPGEWSAVPVSDGSVQLERHLMGVDIEIRCTASNTCPSQRTSR
jgi:hypothetical protein